MLDHPQAIIQLFEDRIGSRNFNRKEYLGFLHARSVIVERGYRGEYVRYINASKMSLTYKSTGSSTSSL